MTRLQIDTTIRQPGDHYLDTNTALYMIHHIFLPPQLPQKDDFSPLLNGALADMVLGSLQEFRSLQGNNRAIDAVASMTHNFRTVHSESGHIIPVRLEESLTELSKDGTFYCIALQHATHSK